MKLIKKDGFTEIPFWKINKEINYKPSHYFSLKPVGIDTEYVESLTSYISRLAESHSVTPTRLLYHITEDRERLPLVIRKASISRQIAKNINSYGETAENISNLLVKATTVRTLKKLTLLSLTGVVSNISLQRRSKVWCPYCFADSLNRKEVFYEKLVWSLDGYVSCSIHNCSLTEFCPNCRREQNYLHRNSRVGFCQYCFKFLGNTKQYSNSLNECVGKNNTKNSKILSQLVFDLKYFKKHQPETLVENLKFCIDRVSMGRVNDFVYTIGASHMTIRRILKSQHLPTINTLLNICRPLDISIRDLYSEHVIEFGDNCSQGVAEGLKNYRETKFVSVLGCTTEEYLQKLLLEKPPVSGAEAARRLGWHDTKLYRNFPLLYNKFVEQYKAFHSPAKEITDVDVKKALSEAFDHYPPPSLQSVFKELGIKDNGYKYQQKFKWLCGRITRHYNTYRSRLAKGEEEAKVIIRNALVEIPPPTISDISRRLGISRERVRFLFPREYEKISDRSYKFIVQERQLKSAKLKNNIDRIVKELAEKEIYPSENLVKNKLNVGYNDSEFKKILKRARIRYR